MQLPTENEINVFNSLDEITASEHFLNKTLEEAEALFRQNSSFYQEDLMWMGPKAFRFYLHAAINYLKSEYASGDDHLIDCLYEIVVFRSTENEIGLARDVVNRLIGFVIENYDKFTVDIDIYGNLLEKYKILQTKLK